MTVYADPIERTMYAFASYTSDFFERTGHTPNMLTTYSVMFKVMAVLTLWYNKLLAFCVLYFVSYIFDCMDGFMARKYKMYSIIGDMYDHISDNVTYLAIILIVIYKLRSRKKQLAILLIATTILGALQITHLACISKQKKDDDVKSVIDHINGLCIESNPFGTGMFSLAMPIMIAYTLHI